MLFRAISLKSLLACFRFNFTVPVPRACSRIADYSGIRTHRGDSNIVGNPREFNRNSCVLGIFAASQRSSDFNSRLPRHIPKLR
ncbi:hypothetical protein OESDEN_18997 [Oesophagostomum dentatum]|uniref:Secreted protein n=1 Tax=Oesophagostomum dentatum TaxID=61180 RepID=A0A0B1SCP0_OESDE|nr:hypothetical protein OESDEN_18997 [Oesophagostomum dentatum]